MLKNMVVVFALTFMLLLVSVQTRSAFAFREEDSILNHAAQLFEETMQVPERALPESLLSSCRCILVFPFSAGIIWKTGDGLMTCRSRDGVKWSTPVVVSLTAHGGGKNTSVILLAMTEKAESLLAKKHLMRGIPRLGSQMTTAPGPVGWKSDVDPKLAEIDIIAWAKKGGIIAGVNANRAWVYQPSKSPLGGPGHIQAPTPDGSLRLLEAIRKYSSSKMPAPDSGIPSTQQEGDK
jgi:lipid-binding SYLF domain-containing protein